MGTVIWLDWWGMLSDKFQTKVSGAIGGWFKLFKQYFIWWKAKRYHWNHFNENETNIAKKLFIVRQQVYRSVFQKWFSTQYIPYQANQFTSQIQCWQQQVQSVWLSWPTQPPDQTHPTLEPSGSKNVYFYINDVIAKNTKRCSFKKPLWPKSKILQGD